MKTRLFCLMFFLIILSCKNDQEESVSNAQRNGKDVELPPLEEEYDLAEYKWGFMNKHGRLIVQNIFDEAGDFNEGKAPVRIKGKWGVIDNTGNFILPP